MNMNVGVVVVVRGWVLCALNEEAEASWRKGWHHWMLSLWPCLRLRIPTNGILTHIPGAFPDKEGEGSDSNGVFIDYDFSFGLLLWLDSVVWLFAGLWVIAKNLSDSEGRIYMVWKFLMMVYLCEIETLSKTKFCGMHVLCNSPEKHAHTCLTSYNVKSWILQNGWGNALFSGLDGWVSFK